MITCNAGRFPYRQTCGSRQESVACTTAVEPEKVHKLSTTKAKKSISQWTSEWKVARNQGASNSLSSHPEICAEWNYHLNGSLEAADFKAGSHKKVWWRCPGCKFCGRQHDWQASICNRVKNGTGCPYCKAKDNKVCPCSSVASHQSLGSEFDTVANYPLSAENLSLGSSKKVRWKCLANASHSSYVSPVKQRSGRRSTGCPQCAREILRPGIWHGKLADEYPDLAKEWVTVVEVEGKEEPDSPLTLRSGSNVRAIWRCSRCAHVWEAAVNDRALKKTGCALCNRAGLTSSL